MMSIGLEVWALVEKGYNFEKDTPIEVEQKEEILGTCKGLQYITI